VVPSEAVDSLQFEVDSKEKRLQETALKSEDTMCSINLEQKELLRPSSNECNMDVRLPESQMSGISGQPLISQKKGFPQILIGLILCLYFSFLNLRLFIVVFKQMYRETIMS